MNAEYVAHMTELRLWLFLRQNGRCLLCGQALDPRVPVQEYGGTSLEHVIPHHAGGTSHRQNLAVSHQECNRRRGRGNTLTVQRPSPRGQPIPEPISRIEAVLAGAPHIQWSGQELLSPAHRGITP
jgi:hypothetical protein